MIHYVNGDLFDHEGPICNCVSEDLRMEAGIARNFKGLFGGIEELRKQKGRVGDVIWLYRHRNYVLYLITKRRFYMKPTYENIERSLMELRRFAEHHNLQEVGMPLISCGLDGKDWRIVENIIKWVFKGTRINIHVYLPD